MATVLRAGCKINVFLRITGRRPDGYHTLESLFLPLAEPCDLLEIDNLADSGLVLRCDDAALESPDNIIRKAYDRYAAATGFAPGLSVFLRKGIPYGAGLGGGSADAAVMLQYINEQAAKQCHAALEMDELSALAAHIGADVPFFLHNVPALATGIGDKLIPVEAPLPGWHLVLVCPDIRVNTAWAYKAWDEKNSQGYSSSTLTSAVYTDTNPLVHGWRVENSFEPVVFAAYPQLCQIVAQLRSLNATAVGMSGSGSSLFGLFQIKEDATQAAAELKRAFSNVFHQVL